MLQEMNKIRSIFIERAALLQEQDALIYAVTKEIAPFKLGRTVKHKKGNTAKIVAYDPAVSSSPDGGVFLQMQYKIRPIKLDGHLSERVISLKADDLHFWRLTDEDSEGSDALSGKDGAAANKGFSRQRFCLATGEEK